MTEGKQHTDFFTGRIFILFSFFFILSMSGNESDRQHEHDRYSIEQSFNIEKCDILPEPAGTEPYKNNLACSRIHSSRLSDKRQPDKLSNVFSHTRIKQQKSIYNTLKADFLRPYMIQRTLASRAEFPPVS